MSGRRLPARAGEWIDRGRPLSFRFEGRDVEAYAGDVISSALLAAGERVLARSFKYHRPRGVLSLANHDANVLLEDGARTHIRGDVEAPREGAHYHAVNTRGGVRGDRARALAALAPLLPVGFYYKAFFRPRAAFPYWERLIRGLAGLGRIEPTRPGTRTALRHRQVDLLVIGAGVSGIAAARHAARGGLRTLLVDENARPGGSACHALAGDAAAQQWLGEALAEFRALPGARLCTATFAAGLYAEHCVPLVSAEGIERVTAERIIVATGAAEQPAVFRDNDLPGVMLASAAQRLVHRYAVAPCQRAVILTANADGYRVALDLDAAGMEIAAVVDLNATAPDAALAAAVAARGIVIHPACSVRRALPGADGGVAGVEIGPLDGAGGWKLGCDGLLMSVGWAPQAQLLLQGGARLDYDDALGQALPVALPAGLYAAGRVNGVYDFAARVADGEAAAGAVLGDRDGGPSEAPARPPRDQAAHSHPRPFPSGERGMAFVDFDEDVRLKDLEVACREGFDNVELLKRYTTVGMGPSQGKHANFNAARFLADWHGRDMNAIGTTTARPFYHPVALGALAGERCRPQWRTALHDWHEAAGAVWQESGAWLRPRCYGRPESAAIEAEYRAVRGAAGLIDVSTLGKFELFGPGSAELLDLAYTARVSGTRPGRTRYVVMVDQRGIVADDGVVARLGEDRFLLTAGSTHAPATLRTLLQIRDLCGLECEVVDRSQSLAAFNVAGPMARELLAPFCDIDLGAAAFPFLGVRTGQVCEQPATLMRVGFVGELGFEIYCAWSVAADLWQRLLAAGAEHGVHAFGVDTQRLLRLEKRHLIVGQDTDGVTDPFEAGLGGLVDFTKPRFHGRAALELLREAPPRQLVGFTAPCARGVLAESHLAIEDGRIAGRVTSVGYSHELNSVIGLALVDAALAVPGAPLTLRGAGGELVRASIIDGAFYDPGNARQREERAA